jgi:serine phosphatase RsbU (regulator of sigma subunit)/anti-sigma regulatory factor (Ser/Thr protein kinase)
VGSTSGTSGRPRRSSGDTASPDAVLADAVLAAAARTGAVGLAALDAQGRFVTVNAALAALDGVPVARHAGRPVSQLLRSPVDLEAVVREVAASGRTRADVPVRAGAGEQRATVFPLDDAPGVGLLLVDVTATTGRTSGDAGQRLELLSRAAELMVSSLEPAGTLENLCELLVPALADHAFVDLHDGDVLRRVAIRHTEGFVVEAGLQRPVGVPASYAADHPARRAFEHGEVLLVPDVPAAGDRIPTGRDTDFFRVAGVTSTIVLPLRVGTRVLGTVILASSTSGRHYDRRDLALAEELVGHAAAAVANSLRFAEQRSAAVALQRSLLPRSLDPVESLDVAWSYVPGTDGTEVGGDWADVVELPGGRIAVVVGDVMGRGLRAAAVMGQLRTAVRTLALQDPPPSDLLTQLDSIVSGLGDDQIVTCVYGVYDPARATMTLANAGHLPPLLVLEGRCYPLEGISAVPLGVGGVEFVEREVPMPRGAVLALYTDGLVERRGADLDLAVDRLADVLLGLRGTLRERCDSLLMSGAGAGVAGFSDDVALLLVQAGSDPAEVAAHQVLPAVPASVGTARRLAERALASWDLTDDQVVTTTSLLVSELVTNAVRYASGAEVELLLRRAASALWIEVADRDTRSPRMRHASVDDEGGRGLALVQALSGAWGNRTTRDGKVVWVRLDLPRELTGPPGAPAGHEAGTAARPA